MTILAIDPGTKCGWAIARDGELFESGTWDLSPSGKPAARWQKLIAQLNNLDASSLDSVYYELVRRHLGTRAAHVYGGFLAILEVFATAHSLPLTGIPVGTIKKHATGRGNAKKPEMIEAARERWGVEPVDDNEADALCILSYAVSQ